MASMNYFLIILMWSLFSNRIIYHLLTGYEGNSTFFLSPKYQLFSEATPRAIVGTEGIIKVLLPEYQVYQCFIILNNCAIQNSKLQVLFWWISSLLYQCFLKLIHLYVCVFEVKVITTLPNSEQSYKGKVKTHNYINRQNQSTTGKL